MRRDIEDEDQAAVPDGVAEDYNAVDAVGVGTQLGDVKGRLGDFVLITFEARDGRHFHACLSPELTALCRDKLDTTLALVKARARRN